MFPVSDLEPVGGRAMPLYQYTLLSDDPQELYAWAPKLLRR